MKLTTQLNEKMRDTPNIWAPPIYRRLISMDKRARDMAERCLLKIRATIYPPSLTLSKVRGPIVVSRFYLLFSASSIGKVQSYKSHTARCIYGMKRCCEN